MSEHVAAADANAGILRYLAQGGDPRSVMVERPSASTDTWRLGAHPDIVEWLWTDLNGALPADARFLVAGGAALAHPECGGILALALGTQYALRLTAHDLQEATARGYESRHTFQSVGRTLDLAATFGPGWVFGRHDPDERRWIAETYTQAFR